MATRPNRARFQNMTQAEMLADMTDAEIRRNARRGASAAITEQIRREEYFRLHSTGHSDFERCCIIEATAADWRIS